MSSNAEEERRSLAAYEERADDRSPYDVDEEQFVGSRSECTGEWLLMSSVWPSKKNKRPMMQLEEVTYIPALLQIFFEALSNAIDNVARGAQTIKVTISEKDGMISVYNDGYGINTDWHEQKNMYVPEWVFTTYKCGDRWKVEHGGDTRRNDQFAVHEGGCNGLGIKHTNKLSRCLKLETCDGKVAYTQHFA